MTKMDPEKPAVPCGLVAKSVFDDKFSDLKDAKGNDVKMVSKDTIAWDTDKKYKFANVDVKTFLNDNKDFDIYGDTPKTNTEEGQEW